tara:strand:+ start:446 stop:796 length:351 start_codon:yes stop_codon:yes gene_type:complete
MIDPLIREKLESMKLYGRLEGRSLLAMFTEEFRGKDGRGEDGLFSIAYVPTENKGYFEKWRGKNFYPLKHFGNPVKEEVRLEVLMADGVVWGEGKLIEPVIVVPEGIGRVYNIYTL